MQYRQLGTSGLRVSTLTLGTMGFGGTGFAENVGKIDVDGARREIEIARDAGVNLFDTADVYSAGASEEILGKALGAQRDDVLVASKVRLPMGEGPNDGGLSRHHIMRSVEGTLRRLGTDYLDLYQAHEWDGQTPLEETLGAFDDLVRQGKVRYIGCSNFASWHMMKSLWTADRKGLTPFVSTQVHYSLQTRDIENEIVPTAIDQGLGVLVWSPLAGGLLSGKYRRGVDAPAGSRHVEGWGEPPVWDAERLYDIVDELVAIADAHDAAPAQISLAWLLAKPAVTSLVIGARTEEQLQSNLAAAEIALTADEMERLDLVSQQQLPYPFWHHLNAADRLSAADLTLLERHLGE